MAIAEDRPVGFGRLKRKEDPRFIRGQGNYLDDIRLPNMVYGQVLRSPYAHARVKRIDLSQALASPGVRAALGPGEIPQLAEEAGYHGAPVAAVRAVQAQDVVHQRGDVVAAVGRQPAGRIAPRERREHAIAGRGELRAEVAPGVGGVGVVALVPGAL